MTGCDNLEIGDYIGKQMTEIEYMFDYWQIIFYLHFAGFWRLMPI